MKAEQQNVRSTVFTKFTLFSILLLSALSASAAQVTISSINGWTAGNIVVNGRWTGQPVFSKPPLSDAYKNMLAIESQSSSATFTIFGANFGTTQGSVQFLNGSLYPVSGITVTIKSWANTKVEIVVKGPYSFTYQKPAYIRVSRDVNPPPKSYEGAALSSVPGFVGVIKTRGYGQCTWYVAKRRLDAGKSIPTTAYSKTATITSSYAPQLWDGLTYGSKHVAIITSTPTKATAADGTVTYSFTVSEMNALTDERVTSDSRKFAVKGSTIVTKIGSRAGSTYLADGYWRNGVRFIRPGHHRNNCLSPLGSLTAHRRGHFTICRPC